MASNNDRDQAQTDTFLLRHEPLTDLAKVMKTAAASALLFQGSLVGRVDQGRKDFGVKQVMIKLAENQMAIVQKIQKGQFGSIVVDGAYGTGKTELAIAIVAATILDKKDLQVFVVTDAGPHILRDKIYAQLLDLRAEDKLSLEGYILCFPSRPPRPAPDGAPLTSMSTEEEIHRKYPDPIDAALVKRHLDDIRTGVTREPSMMREQRVAHMNVPFEEKVLEVIGVINGPDTFADKARFAEIRNMWKNDSENEDLDATKLNELWYDAFDFTIQRALVVITTSKYKGFQQLSEACKDTTRIIIADDIDGELTCGTTALDTAKFVNLEGTIVLRNPRLGMPF